ncbi:cell wall hydrolase [Desertibacillus haloalkaliphilus]|uniref:cell wall hydrolase n=1 Tax=Desertibacillus haloalkaliphilus TaxID=1328930 RepID=UPI001C271B5B|nr:cell wall hydrolase [Desertibacillus haloalkaliphilus]MBU8907947.1 cell wall hydrolase [Desertibacillus haloalkaliphilus]
MRKLMMTMTLALSVIFIGHEGAEASTVHDTQAGESLWIVANQYGVSMNELKELNNKIEDHLDIGESLVIPVTITDDEKQLLAQLVTAEAKGEPYAGQVAVATVVLNRVKSDEFPNSIRGVIYEDRQFTPVSNGTINQPATESAKRAVNEALAFQGLGNGSLFFYNPETATNHWNAQRQETIRIGNHVFAK